MTRGGLLLLAWCLTVDACGRAAAGREQRDFERMRQQQRYDPYEPSSFFRNGATMQPPPSHTVARDPRDPWSAAIRSTAYLTGASAAGDIAAPPIPIDERTLAEGREQFAISCSPCHGAGGFGGGIMAPNLRPKRPPSLRTPPVSALAAGTIFKAITNGFGQMPAYGWQMPAEARWAVVAYVRSLASQPLSPAARADSANAANLARLDTASR